MIFLKLDGIPGDATETGHKDWIQVTSMDWQGSRNFNTLVGSAGNREGSEPVIGDVVITKKLDKASPKLFGAFCAGNKGLTAIIELTRTASSTEVYQQYILSNVLISGLQTHTHGDRPIETVNLNFTKIETSFFGSDPTHGSGNPVRSSYDVATGQLA